MIIAKTPLRIPLAGGLTDIKPYVEQFGGLTISATIDKYSYVALKPNVDGYMSIKYMDAHEKVKDIDAIRNDLVRECLKYTNLSDPLDIYIMNDINVESGLGSSGALTVGLLGAMYRYLQQDKTPHELAKAAAQIEVNILEGASGYHDSAICSTGGVQCIAYSEGDFFPRKLPWETLQMVKFCSMLFNIGYRGKSKTSLGILTSQFAKATPILHQMKQYAEEMTKAFDQGNLEEIFLLLRCTQDAKQRLPGNFYTPEVGSLLEKVQAHGCYGQIPGGKIGSFLFVTGPTRFHQGLRRDLNLPEVPFHFVDHGVMVQEI